MMESAQLPSEGTPLDRGLRALCGIAAFYRIGTDPVQLARELALSAREADEADLIRAARLVGLKARLVALHYFAGFTGDQAAAIPGDSSEYGRPPRGVRPCLAAARGLRRRRPGRKLLRLLVLNRALRCIDQWSPAVPTGGPS